MDKAKIYQHCDYIIAAANQIDHKGESNSAQILGICRTARMIQQELRKEEACHGKADFGSGNGSSTV